MPARGHPGVRGALPLPAAAAAAAARAARLRDVAGRSTRASSTTTSACCRASSRRTRASACTSCRRSTARRGRCPRSSSSGRGCSSRSAGSCPIPTAPTSSRSTRRSSNATSRSRSASRCTAPTRASSRYGTKTGCRRLFAEQGVRHPLGREDLSTTAELAAAIGELRTEQPGHDAGDREAERRRIGRGQRAAQPRRAERRRGRGGDRGAAARACSSSCRRSPTTATRTCWRSGAAWSRSGSSARSSAARASRCASRRSASSRCCPRTTSCWAARAGRATSAASSPPIPAYATAITREAVKVGERLAKEGVIGRFAMDFVAVRSADGTWESYAIELNLRKGGTTHPFLTLQFLTDGAYDPDTGLFTAPSGKAEVLRRLRPRREPRLSRADGR